MPINTGEKEARSPFTSPCGVSARCHTVHTLHTAHCTQHTAQHTAPRVRASLKWRHRKQDRVTTAAKRTLTKDIMYLRGGQGGGSAQRAHAEAAGEHSRVRRRRVRGSLQRHALADSKCSTQHSNTNLHPGRVPLRAAGAGRRGPSHSWPSRPGAPTPTPTFSRDSRPSFATTGTLSSSVACSSVSSSPRRAPSRGSEDMGRMGTRTLPPSHSTPAPASAHVGPCRAAGGHQRTQHPTPA